MHAGVLSPSINFSLQDSFTGIRQRRFHVSTTFGRVRVAIKMFSTQMAVIAGGSDFGVSNWNA